MLLSDRDILLRIYKRCPKTGDPAVSQPRPECDPCRLVIEPFVDHKIIRPGKMSCGLQGAGYDLQLGSEFKDVFLQYGASYIDPEDPNTYYTAVVETNPDGSYLLMPRESILGCTLERFEMPTDVAGRILTKSTCARLGIDLNTTPAEPGWKGVITLEIFNQKKYPVLLRPGMPIGQIVFEQTMKHPLSSYQGAYQNAKGVEGPKVV